MSTVNPQYDLAIIGAGITGIGIALAAKELGLKCLLLDSSFKPATAASGNSLRIIHGGFRYLQKLDLLRTNKSIQAQKELLERYSELIVPLKCLMPLNKNGLKSKYPAILGALLYAICQKVNDSKLPAPKVVSRVVGSSIIPELNSRLTYGALLWYDAIMLDPEALVNKELESLKSLVELRLNTQIAKIIKEDTCYRLQDSDRQEFHAKAVVNAAAYGGQQIELSNIKLNSKKTYWGKSFNLVFKDTRSLNSAFAISSHENRQYFVVPRGNNIVALGTFTASAEQEINPTKILSAIESFNLSCPEFTFDINNLISVEEGILPAKSKFTGDSDFLNSDLINQDEQYLEVFTAKYTTYRLFGRKIIKQILRDIK